MISMEPHPNRYRPSSPPPHHVTSSGYYNRHHYPPPHSHNHSGHPDLPPLHHNGRLHPGSHVDNRMMSVDTLPYSHQPPSRINHSRAALYNDPPSTGHRSGHPLISPAPPPQSHPHRLIGMESYFGFVRTPQDAILLFEACRLGRLHRVQRRLTDNERQLIRAGSVFIWDEIEAGMRRWTDGKSWSASRVSGSFLTYREMEGRKPNANSSFNGVKRGLKRSLDGDLDDEPGQPEDTASEAYRYKLDGLVKQSFSITTKQGVRLHLISYFARRESDVEHLPLPSSDPMLADINPLNGLYPETAASDPPVTSFPPNYSAFGMHPGHPHNIPPMGLHHVTRASSNPAPNYSFPGYPSPSSWTGSVTGAFGRSSSYAPSRGNSSPTPGTSHPQQPGAYSYPDYSGSSRPPSVHGDIPRSSVPASLPPLRPPLEPYHLSSTPPSGHYPNPTSHPTPSSMLPRTRPYSNTDSAVPPPQSPVLRHPRRTPVLPNATPRRCNSTKVLPSSYRHSNSPSQYPYMPYPDRPRRTISPQGIRPCSSGAPLPGIRALLHDEPKFSMSPSSTVPSPTASSVVDAIITKRSGDGYSSIHSPNGSNSNGTSEKPSPRAVFARPPPPPEMNPFRTQPSGQPIQLPCPDGRMESNRDSRESFGAMSRSLPPLHDPDSSSSSTSLSRYHQSGPAAGNPTDGDDVPTGEGRAETNGNHSSSWPAWKKPGAPYVLPPLNATASAVAKFH